jgi:hypothetical protein
MIGFLQGTLLAAAILTLCTIGGAVWLIAWGTRRYKLAEAWERGYLSCQGVTQAQLDGAHLPDPPPNPYLNIHEQAHRG